MSWKKVFLNDICRPRQWKTISTSDLQQDGYPVYGANGKIGFYKEYTHESETLLITCRGATCGTMNICEPKSYVNGNAMALDNLSPVVDIKFLFYTLNYRGFDDIISGSAQPQITGQGLSKIKIPLPDLQTQKHIASILDKADALRQQNRQLLAHYDALLQSTFIEMFGKFNSQFHDWKTLTIEDIADTKKGSMRTGPFGSDLLHSEFVDSGVFVLGIDNVVNNTFEWDKLRYITLEKYEKLQRYTVKSGDLLISIMATVGRVAIVPEDMPLAINSKHLAAITLNKKIAEPIFIAYNLHSNPDVIRQINSGGRGAIMTGLNLGLIRKIEIKIPPLILQQQFVKIVQQIEIQKEQAKSSLAESEALFQGLLSTYFGNK